MREKPDIEKIKDFYETTYYGNAKATATPSLHLRNLADKLSMGLASQVLDIACGTGEWLRVLDENGHHVNGVDISDKAIEICKSSMPAGNFYCQDAQRIPYPDNRFDLVSCLGSLEHFPDKPSSIVEMKRVTRPGGKILILVPNINFIGIKLGVFQGTQQKDILETPLSLEDWTELFEKSGLEVVSSWKDLHVISRDWIMRKGLLQSPLRLITATSLALLPDSLQYQNYFLCSPGK